jgi:hypothetical protein
VPCPSSAIRCWLQQQCVPSLARLEPDSYANYLRRQQTESSFAVIFAFKNAKLVQAERNTKSKTKFLIFISEAPPNLSKFIVFFVFNQEFD